MALDLSGIKKIYFIGIKGVAMSGLAVICKQRGMAVAGCDAAEKFITDKILAKENILVFEGFKAENLDWQPELVVIGASWGADNPEVKAVEKRKIPSISDSQMRGLLSAEKETIAVAGIHGKTTTTALLAYLFEQAGLEPSFLVGTGNVPDLKGNARWAKGKNFIVEGDEYVRSRADKTPKFLDLQPAISIITNVELEHVDVFKNLKAVENAFAQLIDKTKDLVVACGDWPSIKKIIKGKEGKVVTYGLGENNLWRAYDIRQETNQTIFKVRKEGTEFEEFSIKLLGQHNALNALACIIVGLKSGIDLEKIRNSLKSFSGAERRLNILESKGIVFIDDYAHHPTEIKATLKTIRQLYPGKEIWCIFQPHMASRTKAFLNDFAQSFSDVDKIIFADIFASAREKAQIITSKDLVTATKKYHQDVLYGGNLDQIINYLKNNIKPGLVVITMGAGDIYQVKDNLTS